MRLEPAGGGTPQVEVARSSVPAPRGTADGQRLQILTTEHWSLLATRSMSWNESFSRMATFLSLLSGATVALALVAQATGFREGFTLFAVLLLPVVLFVGVATYVRLCAINNEDLAWVAGMNRMRHAYFEAYPDLAGYFVTSDRDDLPGISRTMGMWLPAGPSPSGPQIWHAFITMPGMLAVVDSAVAAVLGGVVLTALGLAAVQAVGVGVVVFFVTMGLLGRYQYGNITGWLRSWTPRFPSPAPPDRP